MRYKVGDKIQILRTLEGYDFSFGDIWTVTSVVFDTYRFKERTDRWSGYWIDQNSKLTKQLKERNLPSWF